MTIRKLIALLEPYAVGAKDGEECEVFVRDGELVVDMGSDIACHWINGDDDAPAKGERR